SSSSALASCSPSLALFLTSPHDSFCFVFLFDATATTAIYTLSLHDALPIWSTTRRCTRAWRMPRRIRCCSTRVSTGGCSAASVRSEEHTSELQSRENLVCRLLLEKKKKKIKDNHHTTRTWIRTSWNPHTLLV